MPQIQLPPGVSAGASATPSVQTQKTAGTKKSMATNKLNYHDFPVPLARMFKWVTLVGPACMVFELITNFCTFWFGLFDHGNVIGLATIGNLQLGNLHDWWYCAIFVPISILLSIIIAIYVPFELVFRTSSGHYEWADAFHVKGKFEDVIRSHYNPENMTYMYWKLIELALAYLCIGFGIGTDILGFMIEVKPKTLLWGIIFFFAFLFISPVINALSVQATMRFFHLHEFIIFATARAKKIQSMVPVFVKPTAVPSTPTQNTANNTKP